MSKSGPLCARVGSKRIATCAAAALFAAVIGAAAVPLQSAAQSEDGASPGSSDAIIPEGVPPLPDDAKGPPLVINSANVLAWKAIVVPELLATVKSGEVALGARRKLGYHWRISDAWDAQSRKNAEHHRGALASESGQITGELIQNAGFPFGNESEVLTESTPSLVGSRVLWNLHGAWWGQGSLDADFNAAWMKSGRPTRVLRGRFVRAYPAVLGSPSGALVFKEKIEFSAPEAIAGLAWLTFRFAGSDEDVVWFFSPALEKARQLTGSNRSDLLARGTLSADDMFVWSGKPELVDASADRSVVALAPFAGAGLGELAVEESGCITAVQGARRDEAAAPTDDDPAALLTNAVFVPRRLWRLELRSNDPYSLYGRQVVYVDKASMLPLYKFVYDRSGHLWKSVIGVFGLGATADRAVRAPFIEGQMVIDHLHDEADVVSFSKIQMCRKENTETAAKNFDPRRLWPQPTPTPAAQKKAKK